MIHDGSDEVVGLFPANARGMASQVDTKDTPSNYFGAHKKAGWRYGRGDSGSAARFFYCAKADRNERGPDNRHPTVKPLALMEYLCRLLSAPGQKGVLLDPFAGSGSTLLVATRWFERVIGIEKEETYCRIAANRLKQEVLFT